MPASPALPGTVEPVDFAIVGAGIAGASLAARLAPHARVLLLERESQPGYHSTGRSAAMFMESYGTPQVRALTRAGRAFYSAPPEGFADAPLLTPRLVLYAAWQGDEEAMDRLWHGLDASGIGAQRVDAAEALRLAPMLRADGLIGGITEPYATDIDVHALHQGWLRSARRAGALLWTDAEVARLESGTEGWTLHLADGRTARAATVVNAAGAWADQIAARAGLSRRGLQPKRRSAFTFDPPAGSDHRAWPAVCAIDETWYIKPDAGQMLGSPANADPVPAQDVQPEEMDIAMAMARIEERTTLPMGRPRRTWAGLRTFAPDGDLVIGPDPGHPGFFWLAGQGGYGIQSAAGVSLLAASLLLKQPLPDELQAQGVDAALLSPGRLPALDAAPPPPPVLSRNERLLAMLDLGGLGLEIGPGFNPLVRKADGHQVETLDHATQEELVKKYTGAHGVDTSRIEPVDYVSTGASVYAAIGKPGRFRWIVASHVIEHTTDLLGFLQDCERLLQPDGVLALAVPDKRFSFDVLRPLTSTGDVLQAHLEGRTRHPPGRVFDEVAYNCLRGGVLAWGADNHDPLAFFRPLADAKALFDHARGSSDYIDIHGWQFTPSSFRLIVNDLFEIGSIGLREADFDGARGSEFFISLSRDGAGPGLSRIGLAQQALMEQAVIKLGLPPEGQPPATGSAARS